MSQKLTLSRYLQGGGEVKTLTRVEAVVFRIPYPLQPGWPSKYGSMTITDEMVDDIRARIAVAKESTAKSAHRRLDALTQAKSSAAPPLRPDMKMSPVPGFVLRRPKRHRSRSSAPWA